MHADHAGLGGIIAVRQCGGNDGDLRLLHEEQFAGGEHQGEKGRGVVQYVERLLGSGLETRKRLEENVAIKANARCERELDPVPHFLNSIVVHRIGVSATASGTSSGLSSWRRARAFRYVPPVTLRLLAIVALLALNGFFVAAEFSVVRSRRSRLEAMARGGDAKARLVLKATANLAYLLSAGQFGITLASIGIGALAEETLSHVFAGAFASIPAMARFGTVAGLGTLCALAVVTYGHVVFGELAPRSAALNHPEEVARWLVPPLLVFAWSAAPFTFVLTKSAGLVLRMFGQRSICIPLGIAGRKHGDLCEPYRNLTTNKGN